MQYLFPSLGGSVTCWSCKCRRAHHYQWNHVTQETGSRKQGKSSSFRRWLNFNGVWLCHLSDWWQPTIPCTLQMDLCFPDAGGSFVDAPSFLYRKCSWTLINLRARGDVTTLKWWSQQQLILREQISSRQMRAWPHESARPITSLTLYHQTQDGAIVLLFYLHYDDMFWDYFFLVPHLKFDR